MGLYNWLHGTNSATSLALTTLKLTTEDFGRFRDVYIEEDRIAIYTRNGGTNRECFEEVTSLGCKCSGCLMTKHLPKHPNYLFDEDDLLRASVYTY